MKKVNNKPVFVLWTFSFLFCTSVLAQDQLKLCSDRMAKYTIYSPATDNDAGRILQKYLFQVSGASFQLSSEKKGNQIVVADAATVAEFYPGTSFPKPGEGGIAIKAVNENLVITGSSGEDVVNAVYDFLERYLGCRYYAENAVYVPARATITFPDNLNYEYTPVIKYRYVNYSEAFKDSYAAWNKLKNPSGNPNNVKMPDWGLWVHSMFKLVPPEKYFKEHPEYYALIKGKRVKTQLCLTNKEVLNIAIQSLAAIIKANPQAKYFSVSQMDNNDYCQCENCSALISKEQSPSGPIINFVNQVAAQFPNKTISTLAYNYSRRAPRQIKPASNVNVFFCATGANRAIPFIEEKNPGSVYSDLKDWKTKTSNIFFWDYVTDFRNLYMPFANYHTLQPNMQFLADNRISYVFAQGWVFASTEMSELRCWLLAKLLWNPGIDAEAAKKEFLDFYYGKAGTHIGKYLATMTKEVSTNKDIVLTTADNPLQHENDYLSVENLKDYKRCFADALEAVKGEDPVYKKRVENAMQPLRYAILEVEAKEDKDAKNNNYYKSQLDEFNRVAVVQKQDILSETDYNKLSDYYAENNEYIKSRLIKNLATGATAKVIVPAGYMPENGLAPLFDGMFGNKQSDKKWVAFAQNYVELVVDLESQKSFDSISMNFIHDPVLLTQLPSLISFAISNDGKNFSDIGVAKNIWPGMGVQKVIKTFKFQPRQKITTRYIRISMRMVNFSMYANLEKPQAMLCDEIVVL